MVVVSFRIFAVTFGGDVASSSLRCCLLRFFVVRKTGVGVVVIFVVVDAVMAFFRVVERFRSMMTREMSRWRDWKRELKRHTETISVWRFTPIWS